VQTTIQYNNSTCSQMHRVTFLTNSICTIQQQTHISTPTRFCKPSHYCESRSKVSAKVSQRCESSSEASVKVSQQCESPSEASGIVSQLCESSSEMARSLSQACDTISNTYFPFHNTVKANKALETTYNCK